MIWHHHHESDTRLVFCFADPDECIEEYDGLVCQPGQDGLEVVPGEWIPCRFRLAWDQDLVANQHPTTMSELVADPLPEIGETTCNYGEN